MLSPQVSPGGFQGTNSQICELDSWNVYLNQILFHLYIFPQGYLVSIPEITATLSFEHG